MLLIDDAQDTDNADDNVDGMLINNVDAKAGRVTGRVALPTGPASKLFSVFVCERYDHFHLVDRPTQLICISDIY